MQCRYRNMKYRIAQKKRASKHLEQLTAIVVSVAVGHKMNFAGELAVTKFSRVIQK